MLVRFLAFPTPNGSLSINTKECLCTDIQAVIDSWSMKLPLRFFRSGVHRIVWHLLTHTQSYLARHKALESGHPRPGICSHLVVGFDMIQSRSSSSKSSPRHPPQQGEPYILGKCLLDSGLDNDCMLGGTDTHCYIPCVIETRPDG